MVSKFRIPTISPLKFSAVVWPLAPGPRILVPAACSERLQDIFDVIRADCSAADAASLFFLPFVRIAITMKWHESGK